MALDIQNVNERMARSGLDQLSTQPAATKTSVKPQLEKKNSSAAWVTNKVAQLALGVFAAIVAGTAVYYVYKLIGSSSSSAQPLPDLNEMCPNNDIPKTWPQFKDESKIADFAHSNNKNLSLPIPLSKLHEAVIQPTLKIETSAPSFSSLSPFAQNKSTLTEIRQLAVSVLTAPRNVVESLVQPQLKSEELPISKVKGDSEVNPLGLSMVGQPQYVFQAIALLAAGMLGAAAQAVFGTKHTATAHKPYRNLESDTVAQKRRASDEHVTPTATPEPASSNTGNKSTATREGVGRSLHAENTPLSRMTLLRGALRSPPGITPKRKILNATPHAQSALRKAATPKSLQKILDRSATNSPVAKIKNANPTGFHQSSFGNMHKWSYYSENKILDSASIGYQNETHSTENDRLIICETALSKDMQDHMEVCIQEGEHVLNTSLRKTLSTLKGLENSEDETNFIQKLSTKFENLSKIKDPRKKYFEVWFLLMNLHVFDTVGMRKFSITPLAFNRLTKREEIKAISNTLDLDIANLTQTLENTTAVNSIFMLHLHLLVSIYDGIDDALNHLDALSDTSLEQLYQYCVSFSSQCNLLYTSIEQDQQTEGRYSDQILKEYENVMFEMISNPVIQLRPHASNIHSDDVSNDKRSTDKLRSSSSSNHDSDHSADESSSSAPSDRSARNIESDCSPTGSPVGTPRGKGTLVLAAGIEDTLDD